MDKNELIAIGKIVGTFGYKGMMKVQILTDFPERFNSLEKVHLAHGEKIEEFLVQATKAHNQLILIKLDGIENKELAAKYKNAFLKITEDEVYPLPEGYYYHFQLEGMDVYDDKRGHLGKLTAVLETGANDVYIIKSEKYGEILIPAIKQVIKAVDVETNIMRVELLEGLIDE
ncbi:MAG TPA: ribosome maturation factor RimM [Syntrophomonadaceae bacterium]|nr:ribosome maturation factor RimM [Syntrophomonadaceae bacterium]